MRILVIVFAFLCIGVTNNYIMRDKCSNLKCSNVLDAVCGLITVERTTVTRIKKFQNICHLHKIKCRLKNFIDIRQVPDQLCNIKLNDKMYISSGRRANDFSIVGSYQSCNHSCPTYCVDTYDPVCAKIFTRDMDSFDLKPMVNHCHVDLFSCVVGVSSIYDSPVPFVATVSQTFLLLIMAYSF